MSKLQSKVESKGKPVKKAVPAEDKAPLSACSQSKLVATVKASRRKCGDLENPVMKIKQEIDSFVMELRWLPCVTGKREGQCG